MISQPTPYAIMLTHWEGQKKRFGGSIAQKIWARDKHLKRNQFSFLQGKLDPILGNENHPETFKRNVQLFLAVQINCQVENELLIVQPDIKKVFETITSGKRISGDSSLSFILVNFLFKWKFSSHKTSCLEVWHTQKGPLKEEKMRLRRRTKKKAHFQSCMALPDDDDWMHNWCVWLTHSETRKRKIKWKRNRFWRLRQLGPSKYLHKKVQGGKKISKFGVVCSLFFTAVE